MSIIVQKYGGSSVATGDKLRHVAGKIVGTRRQGHDVVAVVSAMGNTTSELLDLASQLSNEPGPRELDMLLSSGERISMSLLSMAIENLGEPAISLTGPQSGIKTTADHYDARIEAVQPDRINAEFGQGRVVVVAGFQGETPDGEIATLGRGGSDTTAVALAAALDAERCEIYSDVDGIYSADPRIVDGATRLQTIGYEEMQELARHGAKVLNPRAVTYAAKRGVTIHARSTFSDAGGTIIHGERDTDSDPEVVGVACHRELLRIRLNGDVIDSNLGDELIDSIGRASLFRDNVIGNGRASGARELLISSAALADPSAFVQRLKDEFDRHVDVHDDLGSVSAVGYGVGEAHAGRHVRRAIADGVNVHDSFESPHAVTCLIETPHVQRALCGMHRYFVENDLDLAAA
ncbi:MAG TPA: aspartate kinase [Gammaproteobacteria bacterium]|nr:aspartate kinase [Gammaproteobacteria bacterium]